jgi:RNA polymerase sigma factor (sigma-70 family)
LFYEEKKYMEQRTSEEIPYFVSPEERAHLVRLCAAITHDRDAAEDLAQETLLEAWRQQHASPLLDQTQRLPWLSGVARNMCLRWLRKHQRDVAHLIQPYESQQTRDTPSVELEDVLAEDFDIEVELERKELVELLDRALALLPADTRSILIQRYVEETPLIEVAERLGTNAHAVAMRLQRGKLALRRVLTTTMHHEIAPYKPSVLADKWEETPLWCYICGQHRLLGRRTASEGELLLKCPACSPGAAEVISTNRISQLQGIKGYKPLLTRLRDWCDRYYRTALNQRFIACQMCGHALSVSVSWFEDLPSWARREEDLPHCAWRNNERVVNTLCPSCEMSSIISLEGLVLSLPESRRFLQTSPRIRTLPRQQIEVDGRAALITRFESITTSATLTIVSAYDTYEVLCTEIRGV